MELTRTNQLKIDEKDILHEERYDCPACGSGIYSSVFMEKVTTKQPIALTITVDSISGIDRVVYCKCGCGETWIEKYSPQHHRPLIRGNFMANFKRYERN